MVTGRRARLPDVRLHDDLPHDGVPPARGGHRGPRAADRAGVDGGPDGWFVDAAATAVGQLARQVPVDLWLVTRPSGGARLVAAADGAWSSDVEVAAGTLVRFRRDGQEHVAAARPASRAPGAVVLLPPPSVEVVMTDEDGATLGWLHGVGGVRGAGGAAGSALEAARGWADMTARLLAAVLLAERSVRAREREASRARDLAEHDELTGLHNRRGWVLGLRRCPTARTGDEPVAVLTLDLDGMKAVNDTGGHAAGDALLARCAAVVRRTSRAGDLAARTGGDEFAVLARAAGVTPAGDLERRVRDALASADVAASLGLALRRPGEDLLTTWRRADAAMYADKRGRRLRTHA